MCVYKTLKYLQKSTGITDTFQKQLQVAINNMLNDFDTKPFGDYFSKYYCDNGLTVFANTVV